MKSEKHHRPLCSLYKGNMAFKNKDFTEAELTHKQSCRPERTF